MNNSAPHVLHHTQFRPDGVFGYFTFAGDSSSFMVTLEHAYYFNGSYAPKLKPGIYTCVRGSHRLHGMTEDFSSFEITGVSGHAGILFHWGNFNDDSEGCVLCGDQMKANMITNSRKTFAQFMERLDGVNSFQLQVI